MPIICLCIAKGFKILTNVHLFPTRFEAQLQAVRERLEQARTQKSQNAMAALNFGRIAKPLRGGGAVADR